MKRLQVTNCFINTWLVFFSVALCFWQGCGVGGKISDSDLSKISDSDYLLLRERNLAVKINGNRVAQQEIPVSTKVSKEIITFQHEFPILECDVKDDPIGHPESDKKNPTQTPPKNLKLLTTPAPQPWFLGSLFIERDEAANGKIQT